MELIITLIIWGGAVIVSYQMAEKRGLNTSYAIIGGLIFGWLAPLYYLIFRKMK